MAGYYNKKYFNSNIFNYDYKPVAAAILEVYNPKTIMEFGCGNGELSKALADAGVNIIAIDGYAEPDFTQYKNINFYKVDLNNAEEINIFLRMINIRVDVAVSLEVAEHLNPAASETFIEAMTASADTVIFSAAVPGQGGDGHINCRTRTWWNELFEQRNYYLIDNIRKRIRDNNTVGRWYHLNTCDYRKIENGPTKELYQLIVKNLIASESAASSFYYLSNRKYELLQHWFKLDVIAFAFKFRNICKKLIGKTILKEIDE